MPAFAEEIFGPIAAVTTFGDDDEAVRLANETGYGLAAAVQGAQEHADAIAAQLRAGMVHVNDQTVNEEDPAPFGGFGISGNGASCGGPANLDAFTTGSGRRAARPRRRSRSNPGTPAMERGANRRPGPRLNLFPR